MPHRSSRRIASTHRGLQTPLLDILGCQFPIICAGMGGVARAELAAAVSAEGGLGTLGMVRESPKFIADQVRELRSRTENPFSVNIIPAATESGLLADQIECLIDLEVGIVTLFWDVDEACLQTLKAHGITIIQQIGSAAEAMVSQAAGADILIAQGFEAGGHVRGTTELRKLLPDVVQKTKLPVVAAGGIATSQQMSEALLLGAQGVCMGTRFLATEESNAHEFHKAKIVLAEANDTIHTERFHLNWPTAAPVRVLKNTITESPGGLNSNPKQRTREIGSQDGRPIYLYSTDSPLAGASGSLELMPLYAGHSCGSIDSVLSVSRLMDQLIEEVEVAMSSTNRTDEEAEGLSNNEPASSPCSIGEAGDIYGGYADRGELEQALITLLEAERAGAQVCSLSLKDTESTEWKKFLKGVHRDEVSSCNLIIDCLEHLGIEPNEEVGSFVEKCMAITHFRDRMKLLNKGQSWVVRKLDELLPRLQSEYLRDRLLRMKNDHVENIAHLDEYLTER